MNEVVIKEYKDQHLEAVRSIILSQDFDCSSTLPPIGFIACVKDIVVGYIGAHLTYGTNAFVDIVSVTEPAQRFGIGILLMKVMTEKLLSLGVTDVEAIVSEESTKAISIFDHLGFTFRKVYHIEGNLPCLKIKLEKITTSS